MRSVPTEGFVHLSSRTCRIRSLARATSCSTSQSAGDAVLTCFPTPKAPGSLMASNWVTSSHVECATAAE